MGATCPNCHSQNTQSLASVYKAGTTVGPHGIENSLLALQCAPPKLKFTYPKGCTGGAIGCFAIIFAILVIGCCYSTPNGDASLFVLVGLAACLTYYNYREDAERLRWNRDEFPILFQQWEKTWYCHNCDTKFIPES